MNLSEENLNQNKKKPTLKCSSCGHWNRVQVNKIFIEHNTPEHKVKVPIPRIVKSYVRK